MQDESTSQPSAQDHTSPALGADTGSAPTLGGFSGSSVPPPATSSDTPTPPIVLPSDPPADDIPSEVPSPSPHISSHDTSSGSSDLAEIKKKALDELSPLVGKLDQTPEEKYKTIMMVIQASDNQDLINTAYDAAQQITDEKIRAEALLNIVNEINYFTQKSA